MKRNVLLKTNIFICVVIILGFMVTSIIIYHSNNNIFKRNIEHISLLTSEGIFHQTDSIFTKPINISLTMANDNLLKTFLSEEIARLDDKEFIETMRNYLLAYKEKYGYDSVFLVSSRTSRYYHFQKGVDRIITKGDNENEWYFNFLNDDKEYNLNIDNDQVEGAGNTINIFINCKIFSPDGSVMGVVGVGFKVDELQEIFKSYEEMYSLRAYLVDQNGNIEISTDKTGFEKADLFENSAFSIYKQDVLSNLEQTQSFWYNSATISGFLISKYVKNLGWHLIIDHDNSLIEQSLKIQFTTVIFTVIATIGIVLVAATNIIKKYNSQIVSLTVEKEKMHRSALQAETEKLYENIYEINVTKRCAASEATESYFESLGVPRNLTYDRAMAVIAKKQIKEEHREGYINTFSPENVIKSYEEGIESLQYDFMITNDGEQNYYWMRITARIFFWEEDNTLRMLIYRQNIDSEKRKEILMTEKMQRDSLTGLYNKATTQEFMRKLLLEKPEQLYAFFIIDIDDFKNVNDTFGHSVGDNVIEDFSKRINRQFREGDIVGRIGGDEFAIFMAFPTEALAEERAKALTRTLCYEYNDNKVKCSVSASIGVAFSTDSGTDFETLYQNADAALYRTKKNGKNGYSLYSEMDNTDALTD